MIKRIKVHTTDALKDPGYRFPGNYGVEKFLELFSGKALIKNAHLNFLKSVCDGGLFLFLGILSQGSNIHLTSDGPRTVHLWAVHL